MMPEGQGFNLVISIVVSAAAGTVLGVSLTSTGGNALVGTAISAGLLPPLVNAGMLMSYSFVWAKEEAVSFLSILLLFSFLPSVGFFCRISFVYLFPLPAHCLAFIL
jgi:uncharacterized membrane protein